MSGRSWREADRRDASVADAPRADASRAEPPRAGARQRERATVLSHVRALLEGGPVHMTLIDPASSPGKSGERIAIEAATAGTHAIMVGGSTDVTRENLDALVTHVKEATRLPVIYFPSSAGAMSLHVDALYFLCTMNSRNPRFIVGEQSRGAPFVRSAGMEAIGLGYVIVEPGRKVGLVSEADLVPRTEAGIERAVGYALAAQYFGMPLVYLEAGSGADSPVPPEMIRAVKSAIEVPLVVGGGIREPEQARAALDAGADVLVTGTVAENHHFDRLRGIVREVLARRKDA